MRGIAIPGWCGSSICVATALEEFAVYVDDMRQSSLLVQIIHVLGA